MPRVVNAKLTDNDTIALNRKFQELGYDTASQLLRDISRSKVYLLTLTTTCFLHSLKTS